MCIQSVNGSDWKKAYRRDVIPEILEYRKFRSGAYAKSRQTVPPPARKQTGRGQSALRHGTTGSAGNITCV